MRKSFWIFVICFSIGFHMIFLLPSLSKPLYDSFGEMQLLAFIYDKDPNESNLSFVPLTLDLNTYRVNSSQILRKKLFPWLLHSNLSYYHGEKNSKGIVICTGNQHFNEVIVAIKSLQFLGNDLPIEVFYSTSNDLSFKRQHTFRKTFPNIPLIDLSLTAFNDSYLKLRGWEAKPYAMLASRFEKVILMDADVLFFEKPSILFEHKYFIQTGTLFFHDRPILTNNELRWIKKFLPNNTQPLPIRTQESGVVVIDKSRVFDGLLSICKLNDYQERTQVTYRQLYGDKDTFWLGLHLMNISYAFVPTIPAAIGRILPRRNMKVSIVCGQMLHFDENLLPIWSNGGILNNRFKAGKNLAQIDGWLEEGRRRHGADECVFNHKQKARQFNERQEELLNEYRRIVKEVFQLS